MVKPPVEPLVCRKGSPMPTCQLEKTTRPSLSTKGCSSTPSASGEARSTLRPSRSIVNRRAPRRPLLPVRKTMVLWLPSRVEVNISRPSGRNAGPASISPSTKGSAVSSPVATSTRWICADSVAITWPPVS